FWVGGRRPRSSNSSYARCNSPVLQRLVELAQYGSAAFAEVCRRHGIRRSMGRVGSSYDCQSFRTGSRKDRVAPAEAV
ncbi:hypothetical protein ABZ656_50470, partial [Streptomyces sp. NPDC007095]|uniref:hypothetical protein n=1 Tax=Streptomyces sp. NPDC007095 TaxID=3154482 RepID=UPI0033F06C9C